MEYQTATALFLKKYKALNVDDFQNYFYAEHMQQRRPWFEGCALGYPSTNSGLESTNAWIKKEGTFRERLTLGQLLQFMKDERSSRKLVEGKKCFGS